MLYDVMPDYTPGIRHLCLGVYNFRLFVCPFICSGERGGTVVECRTPEREVRGSKPTAAMLCP